MTGIPKTPLREDNDFISMSTQTENGLTRKSASSVKSAQKNRKKTESRNPKAFGRLTSMHKERNKFRCTTKSDKNMMMPTTGSGIIHVLPEARALNGNGNKLQYVPETRREFEMIRLCREESNDDSLSMISMNSRPSSGITDFPEELTLGDDDEFVRLENFSICDGDRMTITEAESSQSELTLDEISVDSGSPRIQVTELRDEENNNNDYKAEESHLDCTNFVLHVGAVAFGEELENKKAKVKTAWELNEKFHLTTDFPAEVWEKNLNRKALNTRRRSTDLLNASFPPLSTVPGLRRSSVPITPANSLMLSNAPRELPLLSGRQCKVQLPSRFPGMPSPPSVSESEDKSSDDEQLDQVFDWEKGQMARKSDKKLQKKNCLDVPGKQVNYVANASAKSSPIPSRSHSPMASTGTLAINAASNEYLAARVVTQLNSAFKETIVDSDDDVTTRASCVTPNLMPRRYSTLSFRPNTSDCFDEGANSLVLPSVHNEHSKSLPNLREEKTKRMFVAFDKDLPHVNVVDLKGKSDLAQKCRRINHKLSSEDALVKAMLDKKIKKKSMVRKWVISSAQST